MPDGVIAEVVDGFATLEFIDPALKGPGLQRLLATGADVQVLTREGPRRRYRVPEGNAAEAGLLDSVGALAYGDSGFADALAAADAQAKAEPSRPEQRSGSNFHLGSTTFAEARDTAHVQTSTRPGSGSGNLYPPPHAEVIAKVTRPEPGPVEVRTAADIPEGEPNDNWRRGELDAYAIAHGVAPEQYSRKEDLLKALKDA